MAQQQEYELSTEFAASVEHHTRSSLPPSRPLTKPEIAALLRNGTHSEDWSLVRVDDDFRPDTVVGCHITGRCYLGRFTASPESELPQGVYYSTLQNAVVESGATVHRCPVVVKYRIGVGATVVASSLRCTGETAFGNDGVIEPGIETGGRPVPLLGDLDFAELARISRYPVEYRDNASYKRKVSEYRQRCTSSIGYVGAYATIFSCTMIESSWIGDHAKLKGATSVRNSTILSDESDPVALGAGVIVRDSIVQWGSEIDTGALVDRSFMTEHSHVERHGKLTESILGPNSGVAEGEATACVIGPFTAFHHQALLIAALWPDGKGNVGYGANVGSNHTSRLPDQEIWPGEGMFFGLGCNIKFPADFSSAPYTVISTGVTTLPQRLELPFSAITTSMISAATPPGIMQLKPGWVLSDNIYALLRNEAKYRRRNKAKRTPVETAVFRDAIIALMRRGRELLASPKEETEIYVPGDIEGIGKNFVTEADRRSAIDTYDRYIEYGELLLIARDLLSTPGRSSVTPEEGSVLQRYLEHRRLILADARHCREKDWRRGLSYIADYDATHPPVGEDEVILTLEKEIAEEEAQISTLCR